MTTTATLPARIHTRHQQLSPPNRGTLVRIGPYTVDSAATLANQPPPPAVLPPGFEARRAEAIRALQHTTLYAYGGDVRNGRVASHQPASH